jgi:transcriptional regulator with XRE-family HTH domain
MYRQYLRLIGAGFRQLRERRQLKREYIASKCAVSAAAIAKLEQGNADVGMGKIIFYLDAMNATMNELVALLPPPARLRVKIGGCGRATLHFKIKDSRYRYLHLRALAAQHSTLQHYVVPNSILRKFVKRGE